MFDGTNILIAVAPRAYFVRLEMILESIPLVIIPLLVGIVRRAGPDLELRPVFVHTVLDIQTFVAEDANGATGESPLLGSGAGAGLDSDLCAVGVGGGGQAFIWGRETTLAPA